MGETMTIEKICQHISQMTGASFIAVAEYNPSSQAIEWVYADHPLNNRYKRMTVSYGKGVAGRVMQTATPFLCEDIDHLPAPLKEYPIILSEKLRSFAALPISTSSVFGAVLLIGYRINHSLPDRETCRHQVSLLTRFFQEKEAVK
jgi:nitrogen regulatory protein A